MQAMIHGDDFIAVGSRVEIAQLREQVAARFTAQRSHRQKTDSCNWMFVDGKEKRSVFALT